VSGVGRVWWVAYAVGVALTCAAMAWVSSHLVELQRRELAAGLEVRRADRMRVALWRMDSWLTPLLAQEASRPWYEYRAYYEPPEGQYTAMLQEVPEGALLARSPLLTFRSEFLPLHFQIEADQTLTSPQVPLGNARDLAEATVMTGAQFEANARQLDLIESCTVGSPEWSANVAAAFPDAAAEAWTEEDLDWVQRAKVADPKQLKLQAEARNQQAREAVAVEVGPLQPMWLPRPDASGEHVLVFLRTVRGAGADFQQGFVVNWEALRGALLAQIADLLPEASVAPVLDPQRDDGELASRLAAAPARLVPPPLEAPPSAWRAAAPVLATSWAAVAAALAVGALALRASVRWGEKRQRFASSVTHELRTPLTTFRMYSEMLAQGMVKDEATRQEYLRTLERESARLSRVVENVLGYARVEDGRATLRRERHTVAGLLARVVPPCTERCRDAGMDWIVEDGGLGAAEIETDPDAFGLILFNLVDNACKYARGAADRRVLLRVDRHGRQLRFTVEDFGPGRAPAQRVHAFRPFDRAGRGADDPSPGIGLGLALARSLARDLGGDLTLVPKPGPGARFTVFTVSGSGG
jgi:signal transduction histidine kinase